MAIIMGRLVQISYYMGLECNSFVGCICKTNFEKWPFSVLSSLLGNLFAKFLIMSDPLSGRSCLLLLAIVAERSPVRTLNLLHVGWDG